MRASWHPGYVVPLPDGHSFPMDKFKVLRDLLVERGILEPHAIVEPDECPWEVLASVHTPRFLGALRDGTMSDAEVRRMGLPWSEALVRRSRLAVQGTINAARFALEDGIGANLAGGTHHALPDRAEGYCVLNDVAVMLRLLLSTGEIRSAITIDLDVHQGNGVAHCFEHDPRVYTFSMHGEKNFPIRKERSTRDVPLRDGLTDDEYLSILSTHLPSALNESGIGGDAPDLAVYLQGVDIHEHDKFGRMRVTTEGLRARDAMVLEALHRTRIPTVLLLAGGYATSPEIHAPSGPKRSPRTSPELTAALHAVMHEEAVRVWGGRAAVSGHAER